MAGTAKSVNIYLDDQVARDAYDRLTKKADLYNKSIEDGAKKAEILSRGIERAVAAGGKPWGAEKQLKKVNDELAKNKTELEKVTAQQTRLQVQMDSKAGPTLKQQAALVRKLENEYSNLGANTQEAAIKLEELGKASAQLNVMRDRLNNVKKVQQDVTRSTGQFGGALTSINSEITRLIPGAGRFMSLFSSGKQILGNYVSGLGAVTNAQREVEQASLATATAEGVRATATTGATTATTAANTALKLFRIALVSTGIGAIIVLLGSLISYFATTQKGIDAVTSVTKPMVAIFQSLKGLLQDVGAFLAGKFSQALKNPLQAIKDIGSAIQENLINRLKAFSVFGSAIAKIFSGDIIEGFKELGNAGIQLTTGVTNGVDKIGSAVKNTGKFFKDAAAKGTELDKLQKQIETDNLTLTKSQGTLNRTIAEQAEIAKDISKTEKERQAAAQKAIAAINQKAALETGLLDKKIKQMKLEHSLNDTSREDQEKLAQLEADRENAFAEAASARKLLTGTINKINKQNAKEENKSLEERKKLMEDLLQFQKKIADMQFDMSLVGKTDDQKEILRIQKKYADLIKEAEKYKKVSIAQYNQLVKELEALSVGEQGEIVKKEIEKRTKAEYDASKLSLKNYFDDKKLQTAKDYADGVISKEQYDAELLRLEQLHKDQLVVIATDYKNTVKDAEKDVVEYSKSADELRTQNKIKENEKRIAAEKQAAEIVRKISSDAAFSNAELAVASAAPGTIKRFKAEQALMKTHLEANLKLLKENAAKEQNDILQNTAFTQQQKNDLIKQSNETLNNDLKAQDEMYREEKFERELQFYTELFGQLLTFAQSIAEITALDNQKKTNEENAALQRLQKQNDKEKAGHQKLLNNKLISQQEFNKRTKVLDDQYRAQEAAAKKKQWERQQKADKTAAIISGAQAVLSALQTKPFLLGLLLAGVAAVKTKKQIDVINSQPVPEFGKGGKLSGPSHHAGGMPVINPVTGRKEAEVEGGEVILSKKTVRNNASLVNELLHSSMYRGGQTITPSFRNRDYKTIDYAGLTKNIRQVRFFANGGTFPENSTSVNQTENEPVIIPAMTEQQEELMRALYERLNQPIIANVIYGEYEAKAGKVDQIKSDAIFR